MYTSQRSSYNVNYKKWDHDIVFILDVNISEVNDSPTKNQTTLSFACEMKPWLMLVLKGCHKYLVYFYSIIYKIVVDSVCRFNQIG